MDNPETPATETHYIVLALMAEVRGSNGQKIKTDTGPMSGVLFVFRDADEARQYYPDCQLEELLVTVTPDPDPEPEPIKRRPPGPGRYQAGLDEIKDFFQQPEHVIGENEHGTASPE